MQLPYFPLSPPPSPSHLPLSHSYSLRDSLSLEKKIDCAVLTDGNVASAVSDSLQFRYVKIPFAVREPPFQKSRPQEALHTRNANCASDGEGLRITDKPIFRSSFFSSSISNFNLASPLPRHSIKQPILRTPQR